jgi:hypothetical protein
MKQILSLLLSFVLVQSQAWALSGGPFGNTGKLGTVTGTYSGVLVGSDTVLGGAAGGSNALGVFILGVPDAELAQGAIVLFQEGSFFQGGILGVVDGSEGTLAGIAQMVRQLGKSSSQGTGGTGGSLSFSFDAKADGVINADLKSDPKSVNGVRIKGAAIFSVKVLDFTTFVFVDAGTATYAVTGFKQSEEITTPDPNTTAGLLLQ